VHEGADVVAGQRRQREAARREAQRARAYRLKRANAKLRKSLLAQMKSLRAVRRRYDALAESDLIQLSRSFQ